MNKKDLSHYEYSRLCIEDLEKKFPTYKFSLDSTNTIILLKGNENIKIYNDDSYLSYIENKDSLNYFISLFTTVVEDVYINNITLDYTNIYPFIIGVDDYKTSFEVDSTYKNNCFRDFNTSLKIIFYKQGVNALSYVKQYELDSLQISKDSLYSLSLSNYINKIGEINKNNNNGLYIVNTNFFESSLILIDEIWNKENFPVKGDIIVSIPNDNFMMITGSGEKGNLDKMWQITQESYNKKSYRVSPLFYIRKNNKFEVYRYY